MGKLDFIFVFFLGGLVGFALCVNIMNDYWKDNIVEQGYGLYCPNDGKFAFKGECDE